MSQSGEQVTTARRIIRLAAPVFMDDHQMGAIR